MPRLSGEAKHARRTLEDLPELLKAKRAKLGLGTPTAAEQIGISRHTLLRIEAGDNASTQNLLKVLAWLDGKPYASS